MITIVGISGSLRKHSFNAGLLRAAVEAVPEGCTLTIESIKGIPLYDGDVESDFSRFGRSPKKQSGFR
jgi:NAD(P)H-dependent FMN reductase